MVLPTLLRFSTYAKTLAHINMNPDIDGTLRWEMLAIEYQDDYYAPIGLQAARLVPRCSPGENGARLLRRRTGRGHGHPHR